MCRSHFYQVRIQSQLDSRIAHLVLAVLEAIPVVGQIVSLIELKIVQSYARLQPTSCIPRIATIASQEGLLNSTLKFMTTMRFMFMLWN
ncbi:hypothetical protein PARA125_001632 [Parachlamydia sp. AcF125]|nr:hypothetical protein [Parachlamydia sp. AcF125]